MKTLFALAALTCTAFADVITRTATYSDEAWVGIYKRSMEQMKEQWPSRFQTPEQVATYNEKFEKWSAWMEKNDPVSWLEPTRPLAIMRLIAKEEEEEHNKRLAEAGPEVPGSKAWLAILGESWKKVYALWPERVKTAKQVEELMRKVRIEDEWCKINRPDIWRNPNKPFIIVRDIFRREAESQAASIQQRASYQENMGASGSGESTGVNWQDGVSNRYFQQARRNQRIQSGTGSDADYQAEQLETLNDIKAELQRKRSQNLGQ